MLHTTITSNRIKNIVLLLILCLPAVQLFAQDGVLIDYVGNSRESKAIFQINSTTQGAILPRMLASERTAISPLAAAQEGLTVYQTDAPEGYYYWDGALWQYLASSTGSGYIQNLPVTGNFSTGQAASFDVTGNGEVSGTLNVGGNVGIGTTTPAASTTANTAGSPVLQIGDNTGTPELRLAGNNTIGVSSKISFDNSGAGQGMSMIFTSNTTPYGPDGLVFMDENNGLARMKINRDDGMVGIGTMSPFAALTNAGSTAFGTLAVTDHPTGGAIGTAAATVNSYTTFNITQNTVGQTLSLPTPAPATAGRIVKVSSVAGNAAFTIGGLTLSASQAADFFWNGAAWVPMVGISGSPTLATVPINNLLAATGTNTIDNTNYAQVWNWSTATTQTPLSLTANALTTGKGIDLSSNGLTSGSALNIAANGTVGNNSKLINLTRSGTNSTSGKTNYGLFSSISNTNATSATNIAGYFNASGAAPAANYAIIVPATGGNVGIGTTGPAAKLHVHESTQLAAPLGSSQLLSRLSGIGPNVVIKSEWLYRDATSSTDWLTTRLHDAISVDVSFLSPGTDTKVWWERDPYNDIQSWGNAASTYMTINAGNVGIGTTAPTYTLDVSSTTAASTFRVQSADGTPSIIGGSTTTTGGYIYHVFTGGGTFTPNGSANVEVLVVAGGGGSGDNGGGGGGGGGVVYSSAYAVSGPVGITVGGGGANAANSNVTGSNGGNSSFDALVAIGGGGGASRDNGGSGQPGGSGGGGSGQSGGSRRNPGTGSQGNTGGYGTTGDQGCSSAGGGGGGKGGIGGNAANLVSGNGGAGQYYASFAAVGGSPAGYFGGGGGGGPTCGGTFGSGGTGGGGSSGGHGTPNTGGGGGGNTGNGGSGVVIIRYPTTTVFAVGPTIVANSATNVGIGTSTPAAKLEVAGSFKAACRICFGWSDSSRTTPDRYECMPLTPGASMPRLQLGGDVGADDSLYMWYECP
jgi:hypothetical protein